MNEVEVVVKYRRSSDYYIFEYVANGKVYNIEVPRTKNNNFLKHGDKIVVVIGIKTCTVT